MAQSQTNETTQKILDFLIVNRILAYRNHTSGVPITKGGVQIGWRPSSKVGRPDIEGIIPPLGRALLIEVKTGRDHLSEIQEAHLQAARSQGALVMVVKTYDDFIAQWDLQADLSTALELIPEK